MPRIRMETGSRLDLVFHAITGALDDYRLGMVKEAVEQGGGEGTVIIQYDPVYLKYEEPQIA